MTQDLKKVLIVEDDHYIAEVAVMTLEDLGGFEVLHCDCGTDALAEIAKYQPQVVLLDVMLPGMDGPEILAKIREIPGFEHTPVAFMTAKAQVHEQAEYMTLGAIGVIVKPFDPMTLCDQVRDIWHKAHEPG